MNKDNYFKATEKLFVHKIALLMEKVRNGVIEKDTLKDDAFPFEGEMEAMYFSNCRRFLQSKNAHTIMKYADESNIGQRRYQR